MLLCIPGWLRLQPSDDVRGLQNLPKDMLVSDAIIRMTLAQVPPPGFFLAEAPDLQHALQHGRGLVRTHRRQCAGLGDPRSLALPAFRRTPAGQSRGVAESVRGPCCVARSLHTLGLPAKLADRNLSEWQSTQHAPITESEVLGASPELKALIIADGEGLALLSTVTGKNDISSAALTDFAAEAPGVSFVDPLGRIAATFKRIRVRTTGLVILGYLLISALLLWRYGKREALRMVYPPLLALGVTLGVLGWLGEP